MEEVREAAMTLADLRRLKIDKAALVLDDIIDDVSEGRLFGVSPMPDYFINILVKLRHPLSPIDVFSGVAQFGRVAIFKDIRVFREVLDVAWDLHKDGNPNLVRDFITSIHMWTLVMPIEVMMIIAPRLPVIEELITINMGVFDEIAAAGMAILIELARHVDVRVLVKSPMLQFAVRKALDRASA